MADQLAIWNVALAHLGERRLASLTEPREPARVLNDEWIAAVTGCLQMAPWSFATRTQPVVSSGAGSGPFTNAFPKPGDWLRTADIAADAALSVPLDGYIDEGHTWYANVPAIFVRYVSSDPSFGFAISFWHQAFADLVALVLAARVCRRLTGSSEMLGDLIKLREQATQDALAYEEQTAARQYPNTPLPGETRLAVYNAALAHLGRAFTPSLTTASATVQALNDQWRDAVRYSLQAAPWGFACRMTAIPATGTGVLGLASVFVKPADWLRTVNLAVDENYVEPVPAYVEDGSSWSVEANELFVRYVSIDAGWGSDLTRWTPRFCDLVALRLAEMTAGRLAPNSKDLAPELTKMRMAASVEAETLEADSVGRILLPGLGASTRLQISNDALGHIGFPRLWSLTEVSATARAVNDAWDQAVRWSLEQGPWNFATRAIAIGPFAASGPTFGYRNGFKKPDDWVQTVLVSEYDDMRAGATRYADETGWWFSDAPGLFIRYVSSGPSYGAAMARWPAAFSDLVALRLAELIAPRLDASRLSGVIAQRQDAMKRARATDALNAPPAFPPTGSWVTARRGGWRGGRHFGDGPGGSSVPLTGDTSLSGDSDLPVGNDFVPRISG